MLDKLQSWAVSRKTNDVNSRKWQKKPNFGPIFFPHEFYLYELLDIVSSYYPTQFKGTPMNQTRENGKISYFEPDFGQFDLKIGKGVPKLSLKLNYICSWYNHADHTVNALLRQFFR